MSQGSRLDASRCQCNTRQISIKWKKWKTTMETFFPTRSLYMWHSKSRKITRQNPVQHIGFANVARSKSGTFPNMKSSYESGLKLCEDAILWQMPVLMAFTLTFNVPVQDSRAEFTTIDMIKVNISADSDNCIFFV